MVKPNGKVVKHCCKKQDKTEEELFQDELLRAAGRAHEVRVYVHMPACVM